jgi:hypothetical protein
MTRPRNPSFYYTARVEKLVQREKVAIVPKRIAFDVMGWSQDKDYLSLSTTHSANGQGVETLRFSRTAEGARPRVAERRLGRWSHRADPSVSSVRKRSREGYPDAICSRWSKSARTPVLDCTPLQGTEGVKVRGCRLHPGYLFMGLHSDGRWFLP